MTLQQTTPAVTEPAAQPAETGTAAPETGITVPASAELAGEPLPQGDLIGDGVINAADLSLAKEVK